MYSFVEVLFMCSFDGAVTVRARTSAQVSKLFYNYQPWFKPVIFQSVFINRILANTVTTIRWIRAQHSLYRVWLECVSQPDVYQLFVGISNLKSNIFCILSTVVPDSALSILDDLCFHSSLSLWRSALPQWEQHFAFDLSPSTVFYTSFPIRILLH